MHSQTWSTCVFGADDSYSSFRPSKGWRRIASVCVISFYFQWTNRKGKQKDQDEKEEDHEDSNQLDF